MMHFRNYESMAFARWKDVEECVKRSILINLMRRNVARDNRTEDAVAHEVDVIRAMRSRAIVWLGDSFPKTS